MKYYITIIFILIAILAIGQSKIDYKQIKKSWTQGKIENDDKVVQANVTRSGWYLLKVNKNKTVVFSDAFNCGFGHERMGKWKVNKSDTTLTLFFTKQKGFVNTPGDSSINQTEIYKIRKLNSSELILKKVDQNKILPFIATDKIKD